MRWVAVMCVLFSSLPAHRKSCRLHSRRLVLILPHTTGILTRYTICGLLYNQCKLCLFLMFVFVCAAKIRLLPSRRIRSRTGTLPGLVARTPAHTRCVSVSSLHRAMQALGHTQLNIELINSFLLWTMYSVH